MIETSGKTSFKVDPGCSAGMHSRFAHITPEATMCDFVTLCRTKDERPKDARPGGTTYRMAM
jgi:hypothetical protein